MGVPSFGEAAAVGSSIFDSYLKGRAYADDSRRRGSLLNMQQRAYSDESRRSDALLKMQEDEFNSPATKFRNRLFGRMIEAMEQGASAQDAWGFATSTTEAEIEEEEDRRSRLIDEAIASGGRVGGGGAGLVGPPAPPPRVRSQSTSWPTGNMQMPYGGKPMSQSTTWPTGNLGGPSIREAMDSALLRPSAPLMDTLSTRQPYNRR